MSTNQIRLLLLFVSISLGHTPSSASNYNYFESIDNRQGLSSDMVNSIIQDKDGYIWIATTNGLNCYTGNEFEVFKHKKDDPNSLSTSALKMMCIAPDGKLWIGSQSSGINILDPHTKDVIHINEQSKPLKLLDNTVNALFSDSKGRIWILTHKGVQKYDFKTKSLKTFRRSELIHGTDIIEDSNNNIIISTWSHIILKYDEEKDDFSRVEISNGDIGKKAIKSIYQDKTGSLWIGTWGNGLYKSEITPKGIYITNHIDIENKAFSDENMFNIIYDIEQDRYGTIWLGTDGGLGYIRNSNRNDLKIDWVTTGESNSSFRSKDAGNIFIDNAGIIWIGTQGNGISKIDFNQSSFTTYRSGTEGGEFYSNIYRSFWYYKDELYVGMHAAGFGKYDLKTKTIIPYKKIPEFSGFKDNNLDINAITSCEALDERWLWMTSRYKGVILYDTQKREAHRLKIGLNYDTNGSYLIEKNKIWVGTINGLLLLTKDPNSKKTFPYKRTLFTHSPGDKLSIKHSGISDILRDKSGHLWISYFNGGIDKVMEDTTTPENSLFESGIEDDTAYKPDINVMTEDSKGRIWVGTDGDGLWLFNKDQGTLESFSHKTAIKGDCMYSIIEDNSRRIWLSTNRGLSSFNSIDLKDTYETNYNIEDGIQGNIFIRKSGFKDKEGNLYFGGYYGFNYFNPKNIKHNKFIPPLAFTRFEIDHQTVNIDHKAGEVLILEHNNNSFSINFDALSYTRSKNNQFLYKLEGYDTEWLRPTKGINKAIYGKLPAGKYKFLVKGSNNNGIWNVTPLSLEVVIRKSPFQTVLAFAIYLSLFITLLYLYYYYTKHDLRLKQTIKDEQNERIRIEKTNQFKLKFFTNISHELLTPLSIISNAVEQYIDDKPEEAKELAVVQRNTNRLSRLINQILDFRKAEGSKRKLVVERCSIDLLISSIKDNFEPLCAKKDITFNLDGKVDKEIYVDIDKVDKMLHNILSNAFKHTPQDGKITLKYSLVKQENIENICIKVSDNGQGIPEELLDTIFERFYRIDDSKYESGAGIGLAFTKSLVEIHKGTIKAENSEGGGACFTINLPISENAYLNNEKSDIPLDHEVEYSFAEEMDEIKIPLRDARENDKELPKLLIVEDNHDMRNILRNFLSKYFEVYESENGAQGLETLNEVDIEIIISDVMMPVMDGLTFCRKVKTNISTSHIPIILTTAKRTQENYIEGYNAQADSYITKPVNLQLLLVRIINLINQRSKLRDLFTGQNNNKDNAEANNDLAINNLDQELLDKVNEYIEKNIANSDLTIGMLADHVNISQSVFYRKIKAFAGVSPNQYLRTKRLNKSAVLLRQGMNPSEVTYECGFSDPSYFGACFKKQFGSSPKKFTENK